MTSSRGTAARSLRSIPARSIEHQTPVTDWVYGHPWQAGAVVGLILTAIAVGVAR